MNESKRKGKARMSRPRTEIEKAAHKAMIDADVTLREVAEQLGISSTAVNMRMLRGDLKCVLDSIKAIQANRRKLAKSA